MKHLASILDPKSFLCAQKTPQGMKLAVKGKELRFTLCPVVLDGVYHGTGWRIEGQSRVIDTRTLCWALEGDTGKKGQDFIEKIAAGNIGSLDMAASFISDFMTNDGTSNTLANAYHQCRSWEDITKRAVVALNIHGDLSPLLTAKVRARIASIDIQLLTSSVIMNHFITRLTHAMSIAGHNTDDLTRTQSIHRTQQLAMWFQAQGLQCTFPMSMANTPSLFIGDIHLECPRQTNTIGNPFWVLSHQGKSTQQDTIDSAYQLTWMILEQDAQGSLLVHPPIPPQEDQT